MDPRTTLRRMCNVSIALAVAASAVSAQNAITRIAVDPNGVEGNEMTVDAVISADGRYVAFASFASNLVADDTNGAPHLGSDVFVRDLASGVVVRVSVSSGDEQADHDSYGPSISADGRYVAFVSFATNLVAGDNNGFMDIFVHDRDPDGNGVFDEGNGVTTRVNVRADGTECDEQSGNAIISADGRLVLFVTLADNLVDDDKNQVQDIYAHDRLTGATVRVILGTGGVETNGTCYLSTLSPDATLVTFSSEATNLVSGDTNGVVDAFICDLATGIVERSSVDSAGVEGNDESIAVGGMTADNRFVVFASRADNLVAGDANQYFDVFLRDRTSGVTTRVSLGQGGVEGDGDSAPGLYGGISSDGRFVAFRSEAKNMVPDDTNHFYDVFRRDLTTGDVVLVSATRAGGFSNGPNFPFDSTPDLSLILLHSYATDLVSYDTNGEIDPYYGQEAYLRDMNVAAGTASTEAYAQGLAGTNGVPTLSPSTNPVLGSPIHIDLGNSSGGSTLGLVIVGLLPAEVPFSGGTLVADPHGWFVPVVMDASGAALDAVIPSDPGVRGISLFTQLLVLDAGAVRGVSMSRGCEMVEGD